MTTMAGVGALIALLSSADPAPGSADGGIGPVARSNAPTPAAPCSQPPPEPEPKPNYTDPPWPDGRVGRGHFLGAVSFGPCMRVHPDVGGAGPCAEHFLAVDVALSRNWRLNGELGIGFMNSTTSGDASVGVGRSSGDGGYLATRFLVGYDITRLFFFRAGPQLRGTTALGRVALGFQVDADIGTRVGDDIEFGIRTFGGFDGVASTHTPRWSLAGCSGAMLLLRVLFI